MGPDVEITDSIWVCTEGSADISRNKSSRGWKVNFLQISSWLQWIPRDLGTESKPCHGCG